MDDLRVNWYFALRQGNTIFHTALIPPSIGSELTQNLTFPQILAAVLLWSEEYYIYFLQIPAFRQYCYVRLELEQGGAEANASISYLPLVVVKDDSSESPTPFHSVVSLDGEGIEFCS